MIQVGLLESNAILVKALIKFIPGDRDGGLEPWILLLGLGVHLLPERVQSRPVRRQSLHQLLEPPQLGQQPLLRLC